MDVNGLKEFLYETSKKFFASTNMAWVGENSESPPLPLVTLRIDSINKATFPFDEEVNEDSKFIEYYNADTMFEVKAYSKGYVGNEEDGVIQSAENTVMNEMQQFANYIASHGILKQLNEANVQMTQEGPVRDTSVVTSGSRYEYSAMVEYRVHFILETSGEYGISNIEKNTMTKTPPQGMGEETGYFETVNNIGEDFQS